MLKVSVIILGALLAFGVVFAALPTAPSTRDSGVTLQGVNLTLYPAQDPAAEWRFSAQQIRVDPEKGENTLDQLGLGERWVQVGTLAATGSGVELSAAAPLKRDLVLHGQQLVIDAQDNLRAKSLEMYVIQDCSTLKLAAAGNQEVVINQQGGYSAPRGEISSQLISGKFEDITSNFDFSNFRVGTQLPGATLSTHANEKCVNGLLQPA